ncbi:hypothetical protein LL06_00920 [Hoeflea sp. BAL378]|uniref:hypothetical protein n=1 Tax=Hoeflea sp. BAL378 TaxID=1547437 RepID=UPI000512C690|nr:hypothetical protein [Hoeflea sp. BAL378]KGF71186.1 hypothetical protein LL06_00920 [Hoeflea sp. BAL378]
MDDKGRLHITNAEGKETFVGNSYEETGLREHGNRHERRKAKAMQKENLRLAARGDQSRG